MAVINGEGPITVDDLGVSADYIANGQLRTLTVTSAKRSPRLPGVSTMLKLRRDPRQCVACYAFTESNGTPDEIIQRLNSEINPALGEVASPRAGMG